MRIRVIVNPKSRNGDEEYIKTTLKEKFAHSLMNIEYTAYPGHATYVARQATKEKVDTVVAVGGDGTVNEVLNGIIGTDVALGIIPTGTANDLASLYRIPTSFESAWKVIAERHLCLADVICVNRRHYVTAGGLGLPSEVTCRANAIKQSGKLGKSLVKMLGSKIYILAVLLELIRRDRKARILHVQWDGNSGTMDTLSLMVDNQPFFGKHFWMSPGAMNDDGLFDVCWIENSKTRAEVLSVLLQVLKGKHLFSPAVQTWRASELTVQSDQPLTFFGDGEIFQNGAQFHIKILPKALSLIVPVNRNECAR